jgi:hypothetical protein
MEKLDEKKLEAFDYLVNTMCEWDLYATIRTLMEGCDFTKEEMEEMNFDSADIDYAFEEIDEDNDWC